MNGVPVAQWPEVGKNNLNLYFAGVKMFAIIYTVVTLAIHFMYGTNQTFLLALPSFFLLYFILRRKKKQVVAPAPNVVVHATPPDQNTTL